MGLKTLTVCNGCDKELKNRSERYYLYFQTDSFLDAAGDTDYNTIDLVFCEHCAKHIRSTFEKILEIRDDKIEKPTKQPEHCPNCGYKTVSDGKHVCCFACGYNV